jgi:hypothetical protein
MANVIDDRTWAIIVFQIGARSLDSRRASSIDDLTSDHMERSRRRHAFLAHKQRSSIPLIAPCGQDQSACWSFWWVKHLVRPTLSLLYVGIVFDDRRAAPVAISMVVVINIFETASTTNADDNPP